MVRLAEVGLVQYQKKFPYDAKLNKQKRILFTLAQIHSIMNFLEHYKEPKFVSLDTLVFESKQIGVQETNAAPVTMRSQKVALGLKYTHLFHVWQFFRDLSHYQLVLIEMQPTDIRILMGMNAKYLKNFTPSTLNKLDQLCPQDRDIQAPANRYGQHVRTELLKRGLVLPFWI